MQKNKKTWASAIGEIELDDLDAYEYALPEAQIATDPKDRRDLSRLLVLDGEDLTLHHDRFENLFTHLSKGDLLVFNNTRVVPARLQVFKETGGKVELFVLHPEGGDGKSSWNNAFSSLRLRCMTGSSKPVRDGMKLGDPKRPDLPPIVVASAESGDALVEIDWRGTPLEFLEAFGEIPLPPYIMRQRKLSGEPTLTKEDHSRYQTVFATVAGAVAAPTAGLHFTEQLLQDLENRGVYRTELTLTVGPGTFQPVREKRLSDHVMHREEYFIPEGFSEAIEACRERGGRVIAVGTTSARALEAEALLASPFEPGWRSTDIFLKPGSTFSVCQGLITNFHLPCSTLLALVAGFVGYPAMRHLYETAVEEDYRFYSYGDASLLFPG